MFTRRSRVVIGRLTLAGTLGLTGILALDVSVMSDQATAGATGPTDGGPGGSAGGPAPAPSPLISGTVVNSNGTPAVGASVESFQWPSESTLASMTEGDSFVLRSIKKSVTGSAGTFTVGALPTGTPVGKFDVSVLSRLPDGSMTGMDTSLSQGAAGTATLPGLYGSSESDYVNYFGNVVDPQDEGGSQDTLDAPPSSPPSGSAGSPAESSATTSISSTGTPVVTLRMPSAQSTTSGPEDSSSPSYCQYGTTVTLATKYGGRLSAVGGLHATTSGHDSSFTLSSGSNASLGAAIYTGGSWKASGSVSRTLQSETRWGHLKGSGDRVLQTYYSVGKYKVVVGDGYGCYTYYTMKPIAQEGGAVSHDAGGVTATHCRAYEKGGGMTLVKNAAITWTNGFNLKGIVGFDVSATAGYSQSEKLNVDITASGKKICGTNKYPAEYPSALVVKSQ